MTVIATDHAIAQKVWRPGVINEAERQSVGMGLVAASPDSPIMLLEDLTRERGDKIQLKFSPSDHEETHDGFSDLDDIVGNGLDVEFLVDEMIIDYLGESWKSSGMMSQQRTNADIRETSFQKAAVWWSRRYERSILNQAAGFTPGAGTAATPLEHARTGMNAVTTVDENHIIRSVEGVAPYATDALLSADTTAVFSLRQIEAAVKQMMSKSYGNKYPVAPCSDGLFHCIVHTSQWAQLREYSNPADWADLQRALLEGGQKWEQSGFLTGALGVYLNVAIHVSDYIPKGVSDVITVEQDNVRRAVIMGSRGLHMAFGEGYASDGHLDWLESIDDFRKWSVLVDSVFGVKRTEFDGETFGLFVLPSYSDV